MGESQAEHVEDSREATFTADELSELRPSQVCRLLNSTPLGQVISERQLYRHRKRANGAFETAHKRIDLFRYAAWLREQVQARKPIRSRRGSGTLWRRPKRVPSRRAKTNVTLNTILDLLEEQDYACALTGEPLDPDSAALDHVLPISRGGESKIENAQILHASVNRAKHTMTNDEFIEMCRKVVSHADRMACC